MNIFLSGSGGLFGFDMFTVPADILAFCRTEDMRSFHDFRSISGSIGQSGRAGELHDERSLRFVQEAGF